jgi:hypothetical protein
MTKYLKIQNFLKYNEVQTGIWQIITNIWYVLVVPKRLFYRKLCIFIKSDSLEAYLLI